MDGLPEAIKTGKVKMVMALNAHNILTGERGVARVFGPQKGATPEQVLELECGFENWAQKLAAYASPQAYRAGWAQP